MKRFLAVSAVILLASISAGCNAQATAQKAHDVIAGIVSVASSDIPLLQQDGVMSASESSIASGYVSLISTLNGEYETCLAASGNSKSKLSACVSAFASGLASPSELAQLRILNPKAQQKVAMWATAASIALNSVAVAIGGQSVAAPSPTPPDAYQLERFDLRVLAKVQP